MGLEASALAGALQVGVGIALVARADAGGCVQALHIVDNGVELLAELNQQVDGLVEAVVGVEAVLGGCACDSSGVAHVLAVQHGRKHGELDLA